MSESLYSTLLKSAIRKKGDRLSLQWILPNVASRRKSKKDLQCGTPSRSYKDKYLNTLPFRENTPPSTPVRKHKSPPCTPLANLDDSLPCTAHPLVFISAASVPRRILLFPRQADDLATRTLHGKFGGFRLFLAQAIGSIAISAPAAGLTHAGGRANHAHSTARAGVGVWGRGAHTEGAAAAASVAEVARGATATSTPGVG